MEGEGGREVIITSFQEQRTTRVVCLPPAGICSVSAASHERETRAFISQPRPRVPTSGSVRLCAFLDKHALGKQK